MEHTVDENAQDIFDVLGHHLSSADVAEELNSEDIHLIVRKMRENIGEIGLTHCQYEARFTKILQFIINLESDLNIEELRSERLRKILLGSFEASKSTEVVTSLKYVYCNITPIRVAGDLIFSLVSKVVGT